MELPSRRNVWAYFARTRHTSNLLPDCLHHLFSETVGWIGRFFQGDICIDACKENVQICIRLATYLQQIDITLSG